MSTLYLNGRFVEDADATVSVLDRGFIFADGIYEVWRVIQGRLFEAERHQERLERGLRELDIVQPPDVRPEALARIAERLFAANGINGGEATLYLEITRGVAPRSHAFPPQGTPPTVLMMARPFAPDLRHQEAGAAAITTPDLRWLRCDIKTVQLLPNVLANQRAKEAGALEAIFVRDGRITEGSHTSLFGVLDGVLRTHPADHFVLPGVTRAVVLDLAAELGVAVAETPIASADLPRLQELFLCGTTTDITPVVRADDVIIGQGVPGELTLQLQHALRARMAALSPTTLR